MFWYRFLFGGGWWVQRLSSLILLVALAMALGSITMLAVYIVWYAVATLMALSGFFEAVYVPAESSMLPMAIVSTVYWAVVIAITWFMYYIKMRRQADERIRAYVANWQPPNEPRS